MWRDAARRAPAATSRTGRHAGKRVRTLVRTKSRECWAKLRHPSNLCDQSLRSRRRSATSQPLFGFSFIANLSVQRGIHCSHSLTTTLSVPRVRRWTSMDLGLLPQSFSCDVDGVSWCTVVRTLCLCRRRRVLFEEFCSLIKEMRQGREQRLETRRRDICNGMGPKWRSHLPIPLPIPIPIRRD